MSNAVLIIGESGTGKSTSIRTLPAEETFIINVIGKSLPFKGANTRYVKATKDTPGNYFASDDHMKIIQIIKYVNEKMPHIKYLVIDDFGYTISNDFMRKALINGYQKFTEIGRDAWEILKLSNETRENLTCFITMHADTDSMGRSKPKTIGKLLDEKVCIEGMFTIVLHSVVSDGSYYFITNHDGQHMAKSPMGMFNDIKIANDLKNVVDTMHDYYNDEILT